ncbi:MAG: hypothetical protein V1676_02950 [Candidatus Diapherotrites archaeon]
MKLEITGRVKNPLIGREELMFEVSDCVKTPGRKEIRAKLAALCNAKEESIALGSITERFGEHRVTGGATVYPSRESMEAVEEKFVINRTLGLRGRQKKGGKKAAAPAATKNDGQEGKAKAAEPGHAGGGKAEAEAAKAGAEKPAEKAEAK